MQLPKSITLPAVLLLLSILCDEVNAQSFCNGLCIVNINGVSCGNMLLNYDFEGECCAMEEVTATGGCRIRTNNKCSWTPKCGTCDASLKNKVFCNTLYQAGSTVDCPATDINALDGLTRAPTDSNSTQPTMMPTACPEPPTNAPTASPTSAAMTSGVEVTMMAVLSAATALALSAN